MSVWETYQSNRLMSCTDVDDFANIWKQEPDFPIDDVIYLDDEYDEYDAMTLFTFHCRKGNTEIVKYLVNVLGCDITIIDQQGYTGFMWVCEEGHMDIFDFLVDKVDVDFIQIDEEDQKIDKWALYVAVENDQLDIVRKLLEHGADVNITETHGFSVMIAASANGICKETFQLLVFYGINLNHMDKWHRTALHHMAHHCKHQMIEMLLDMDVDTSIKDIHGQTAADIAKNKGYSDIVEMIKEHEKSRP